MTDFSDSYFHKFQSGIIYRKGPSWISVCANGGTLIIKIALDKNRKNLIDSIKVGDRFSTPNSYLDKRYNRVIYTPSGIR